MEEGSQIPRLNISGQQLRMAPVWEMAMLYARGIGVRRIRSQFVRTSTNWPVPANMALTKGIDNLPSAWTCSAKLVR